MTAVASWHVSKFLNYQRSETSMCQAPKLAIR